jgi:hypothetical protein
VSKNVFLIGLILAASGLVSPPIAMAGGLIYGFSFIHPYHVDAKKLSKILLVHATLKFLDSCWL